MWFSSEINYQKKSKFLKRDKYWVTSSRIVNSKLNSKDLCMNRWVKKFQSKEEPRKFTTKKFFSSNNKKKLNINNSLRNGSTLIRIC